MLQTTLKCPNCGESLPDASRGSFSLYAIHADYLCPHCESVIEWEQQHRSRRWVMCLCGAVFLAMAGTAGWEGLSQRMRIMSLLGGHGIVTVIALVTYVRSLSDPWELVKKKVDGG